MSLITCLIAAATAAEVVWLTPPEASEQAAVAASAGAQGAPLSFMDLRTAASGASSTDDDAYRRLGQVLADVRAYETKLDGELLILRDLEAPLAAIGVVRDGTDRQAVFDAFAYQGFAANRFWGSDLATDDEAADWRVELNGQTLERPWRDAASVHPEAEVTAYQIAEAPQRVAYDAVSKAVASALPSSLVAEGLPAGAELVIDGAVGAPGAAGDVKVPPGRHWVHVQLDGHVLVRWTVSPEPGEQLTLDSSADSDVWTDWLDRLSADSEVPAPVATAVNALGGEVWIASGAGRDRIVWAVTPAGVSEADVTAAVADRSDSDSDDGASVWVVGGVGWFSSGNFYTDAADEAPRTGATVNAIAPSVGLGLDVDAGWFRAGVGVDMAVPLGENHAAEMNDGSLRPRPLIQASVGVRPVQAVFGYMLPYHPVVGGQATWTFGSVELRGGYAAGLPGIVDRDGDGPDWERLAVHRAGVAVGARF
ncbi:MAG: hypothetical protein ACI9K2_001911 [Myxococcota bacterium]